MDILTQLEKTKADPSLLRREFKLSEQSWRTATDRVDFCVTNNASNRLVNVVIKKVKLWMLCFVLFHPLVILGVMWKHYVTSPFQNYAEFSVSTTRRTLQQRHASKAMSHPAIHTFYLGPT